jgi:diguanylate cyclase (GGDEF)-like protein
MNRVQPKSLGDAYPALCNFMRLTSLTLTAQQLALTVQVGNDWRHGGVMNYGQMPAATLREVLSSQPVTGLTVAGDQISLATYSRSQAAPVTVDNPVLVGHLHSADNRYHLTLYVPDRSTETLGEVQIKTLQYLSQQLMLCLTLAQPKAPRSATPAEISVTPPASNLDFLSRVVALGPTSPVHERLHQGHPRLVDLVAQLQSCLSYEQLGQLLSTHLPYFFPHQSGRLALFSHVPPDLTVLTQWGEEAALSALDPQCCYPQDEPDYQLPGVGHECHQCEMAHCPTQRAKCIVLGLVNDTTCLVQMVQAEATPFSPVQTALLKKLSEQVLFVMQRLLLLDDLQDQAIKDPLTGLLNRRHAETVLNSLCNSANGHQQISIILIDIDHFKVVNDTYGHQAGDEVLKNIGMLLRGHVRSQDIVCRYGGEEFCMVLLDTSPEVALKRAEKIRRAVKYINSTFNGEMLPPLTISLGVASYPNHGETPHSLITLADKALYWAKNNGRDRAISVDHMLSAGH